MGSEENLGDATLALIAAAQFALGQKIAGAIDADAHSKDIRGKTALRCRRFSPRLPI
jgi:hypothetical protein